jgi:hypothetical protein
MIARLRRFDRLACAAILARVKPQPLIAFVFALVLAGCHGPGQVEFSDGQCRIDGQAASRPQVEARQAAITERILARQPLFVLITVLIVALAGASHVEKLLLFARKKDQPAPTLQERLRLALDRYRSHPVRYFTIVGLTLTLLVAAGGVYVYLDADKRASERALGQLQFCDIALRNGEAESVLAEQKHNLLQIESTAGDIRAFVNKLPPEEQHKARQMMARIDAALAQEGKLVGAYAARSDESARAVRAETQALGKGLTSLEGQVTTLKTVPAALHDLGEQLHAVDGAHTARLTAIEAKIDALAAHLEASERAAAKPAAVEGAHPPDATHAAAPSPASGPAKSPAPADLGAPRSS